MTSPPPDPPPTVDPFVVAVAGTPPGFTVGEHPHVLYSNLLDMTQDYLITIGDRESALGWYSLDAQPPRPLPDLANPQTTGDWLYNTALNAVTIYKITNANSGQNVQFNYRVMNQWYLGMLGGLHLTWVSICFDPSYWGAQPVAGEENTGCIFPGAYPVPALIRNDGTGWTLGEVPSAAEPVARWRPDHSAYAAFRSWGDSAAVGDSYQIPLTPSNPAVCTRAKRHIRLNHVLAGPPGTTLIATEPVPSPLPPNISYRARVVANPGNNLAGAGNDVQFKGQESVVEASQNFFLWNRYYNVDAADPTRLVRFVDLFYNGDSRLEMPSFHRGYPFNTVEYAVPANMTGAISYGPLLVMVSWVDEAGNYYNPYVPHNFSPINGEAIYPAMGAWQGPDAAWTTPLWNDPTYWTPTWPVDGPLVPTPVNIRFTPARATARASMILPMFDPLSAPSFPDPWVGEGNDATQVPAGQGVRTERWAQFIVLKYVLVRGQPQLLPDRGSFAVSQLGHGPISLASTRPSPLSVSTGLAHRFLAGSGLTTSSWTALSGLVASAPAAGRAPLGADLTYPTGSNVALSRRAAVFRGRDWLSLPAATATALTLVVVGRFRAGPGPFFGIAESNYPAGGVGETQSRLVLDLGLRYTNGAAHLAMPMRLGELSDLTLAGSANTPTLYIVAADLANRVIRLLVVGTNRASRSVTLPGGYQGIDAGLLIGRAGGFVTPATMASMDLFELGLDTTKALSFSEMDDLAAVLCNVYGVTA